MEKELFKKLSQEEVIKKAKKLGYDVTNQYLGVRLPLQVKCEKGHLWETTWDNILSGAKCFHCFGSKKYTQQEIQEYANHFGYTVLGEYKNNKANILMKCPDGHNWECSSWSNFKNGHRCGICCGLKRKTQEEIQEYANSFGYTVLGEYKNKEENIELKCPLGHLWNPKWGDFKSKNSRCPQCSINKPEQEIFEFLTKLKISFKYRTRQIITPLELDFYFPNHNLAIEYCGLYWHSEAQKDKNYHLKKLKKCQEKGIRLITIFEDEWLEKREIVLSRILGVFKLHKKIYARKCILKEIPLVKAKDFLNKNHLQGYSKSIKAWGLFYEEALVSAMTIGKHHRQGNKWVLNRFCNALNTSIIGGASKLLIATWEFRPLISWADLRWSEGNVYEKLGFILENTLKPDYSYITPSSYKRFSKQSLKKTKEERLLGKTEHQLRLEQGYLRVWDCGKQRWVLN